MNIGKQEIYLGTYVNRLCAAIVRDLMDQKRPNFGDAKIEADVSSRVTAGPELIVLKIKIADGPWILALETPKKADVDKIVKRLKVSENTTVVALPSQSDMDNANRFNSTVAPPMPVPVFRSDPTV